MSKSITPRMLPCGHPVTGYRQVRYRCAVWCPSLHVSARCEVCGPYPDDIAYLISEPLTPGARMERARLARKSRAKKVHEPGEESHA